MVSKTLRPKGKPRGVRHDRDCLTCKSRQVKCDLNRPGCERCRKAGLKCQGYRVTVRWAGDGNHPSGAPRPSRGTSTVPSPDTSSSRSPAEYSGDYSINWTTDISNYLEYFAAKLNLGRSEPEISQTPLPSPNTDDLSDIWEFAWKRTYPDADVHGSPQFLHLTALSALSRMVQAGHIYAIFGITTFAFLDVREGPFGDWGRHLRGARALLDTHCCNLAQFIRVCDSTPGLRQAVSLLNWYDVMESVVHQDRQLIFDAFHREYMDDSLFEHTGCERETFQLYMDVVRRRESTAAAFDMEKSCHLNLLQLLKLHPHPHPQHDDQHSTQQQSLLLKDVWRLGAVLSSVVQSPSSSECLRIVTMVLDRVSTIVSAIRQDNEAYIHLALTVYLMGVYGTTNHHQAEVKRYWSFFNSRKVPGYPHAQELCDRERKREKERRERQAT